jgi:hypothetical protein
MNENEEKPLRKRSEVGRRQASLPMDPPPAEPTASPVAPKDVENISDFVLSLKKAGYEKVTLILAAGWGPEKRIYVQRWLVTKNPATFPPYLEGLGGARVPPEALEPSRKDLEALEELRRALMAKGVHPLFNSVRTWTPLQQSVSRAWLEQGADLAKVPEFLEKYVVKPMTPAASAMLRESADAAMAATSWKPEPLVGVKKESPGANVAGRSAGNDVPLRESRVDGNRDEPTPLADRAPGASAPARVTIPMKKEDLPETWGGPPEHPREPPKQAPFVSESEDFNRLVETVLREIDIDREYDELEALLEVGDNRREYVVVYEALDKAERRALRAHGVWANARLEYERLKLDQEEVDADLWHQASAELEAEKDEGKRKKAITIDDVKSRVASKFPDEWRGGRMRMEKAKLAVERCERFSELWAQKVRSLNTMLGSVRK